MRDEESRAREQRDVQWARLARILFWLAGLSLAIVRAWRARNEASYDTVAYFDLARSVQSGDWGGLVNGLWSPGYPALLGITLRWVQPTTYWLYGTAHLLNVLIFGAAMAAFEVLRTELGRIRYRIGSSAPPRWAQRFFLYSVFLWIALNAIGVMPIGPDLLMAVFLILAAGLMMRARRLETTSAYVLLGVVLCLGYFAKAPLLPVGIVMLLAAPLGTRKGFAHAAPRAVVAFVLLVALASPWVVALHARYNRWTWGDSAALNYAWHVNGTRKYVHWQGGPPENGNAVHPTRQIFDHPEAFEYATPIAGSSPPWDDPAYWMAGLKPHFDAAQQEHAIARNLLTYFQNIAKPLGLVVLGFIVLAIVSIQMQTLLEALTAAWPLWLAGAFGLAMFVLVDVQTRYVGGFLLLLCCGLIAGVRIGKDKDKDEQKRAALIMLIVLMGLSLDVLLVTNTVRYWDAYPGKSHLQWQVSRALWRAGVRPGGDVAMLGDEIFWVPMSGLRVIADVPVESEGAFWKLPADRRAQLLQKLDQAGAQVIVTGPVGFAASKNLPAAAAGWQQLEDTGYWIYRLKPVAP